MARHAYFEELCALVPLGKLSPMQLRELDAHLVECDACRQASIDYNRIFQYVVPAMTESDEEYIASRKDEMRAAVMRAVTVADQERERQPATAGKDHIAASVLATLVPARRSLIALCAGIGAACLMVGTFWLGARFHGIKSPQTISAIAPRPAVPSLAVQPVTPWQIGTPTLLAEDSTKSEQMSRALAEEREQNAELKGKLSAADSKLIDALSTQNVLRMQINQQAQTLSETRSALEAKATELVQARSTGQANLGTIAALELQVHDLNAKVNSQTASLDRERDLLSHGREIRDIIGARNLHIIDVYDTGAEGATRKPFARAFYTEGKSLVYYVYDLPQRKLDEGRFSYVAWGESNGNRATIKKIGILFHDDQSQRRWSLNFADPQVLHEIDSVFITLEKSDEDSLQPKGKRMLTAYLATAPNHP